MMYGGQPGGQAVMDSAVGTVVQSFADAITPESIDQKVQAFLTDYSDLHKRMDDDQNLHDLKAYNANKDGTDTFPSYTSNSPRTFAKKICSLLASGEMFVRVPYGTALKEERSRHDMKERFFYGLLESANERLKKRLELRLRSQLVWYAAVRGYICVRATLYKDGRRQTYVDISPLDPRAASWGLGADGLEWAAYTTERTAAMIKSQYNVDMGGAQNALYQVTDYYDRVYNATVIRGHGFVKQPTVHGSTGVPIVIVPVGMTPNVQNRENLRKTAGYGESIFAENRAVYDARNKVLSIYLSLVEKARDRSYVLYSVDGSTRLKDNPNEAAGVIPLPATAKLDLVALAETTKDAAILAGVISEEMHFGSLTKTSYGDVPFQLSGFAINSLRQSVFSILQPLLDAVQDAYEQVLNMLADQYLTGAYDTMQLSGYDSNRLYFDAKYTPEMIAGLPAAKVRIDADLPQDEIAQVTLAQKAREGQVPLLPDIDILDRIMKVQDVGATQDAINVQMAKRMSPRALLKTLMDAAEQQGENDIAAILFGELIVQQLQQQIALAKSQMEATMNTQQAQMIAGGQAAAGPTGGPTGLPPTVQPPQAAGEPQPPPTPQAGPLVPPGTPRPGAQTATPTGLG